VGTLNILIDILTKDDELFNEKAVKNTEENE
jgi:hypothetical protein